jgi:hypothetical protein
LIQTRAVKAKRVPLDPRRLLSKTQSLLLHPDDVAAIQAALLVRWPGLMFVPHRLGDGWIIAPEGAYVRRWQKPVLSCAEGLDAPDVFTVLAWLPPPGWEPSWREVPDRDNPGATAWALANQPSLYFVFDRSTFGWPEVERSSAGRIWAWYNKADRDHVAFLNAVWRVFDRFVTRVVDLVYDDTGRVQQAAMKQPLRIGPRALDWAKADPVRRLDQHLRPAGSPAVPLPPERWRARACEHPEQAKDYATYAAALRSLEAHRTRRS